MSLLYIYYHHSDSENTGGTMLWWLVWINDLTQSGIPGKGSQWGAV